MRVPAFPVVLVVGALSELLDCDPGKIRVVAKRIFPVTH